MTDSTAALVPVAPNGVALSPQREMTSPADTAMASELVERITTEVPVVATFDAREQVIVAAWLTGLRSRLTRKSYANDTALWFAWCAGRGLDPLRAQRVHLDMWVLSQIDDGAENSTVRRRLSSVSGLYKYCASHDIIDRIPTDGVKRPHVDPDFTATVTLDKQESRALIAAADADTGPQRLRSAAVIRLLLHNGLRVEEACQASLQALGMERGHQTLTLIRKGGKKTKAALAPNTAAAIDAYIEHRAELANVPAAELSGPLIATRTGGRMYQSQLWELVRRLAKAAGIASWDQLSPHSLRHASITHFLDAGGSLRDAQDHAAHADPRTTRRYDHSRHSLDRAGSYRVAAYLAE